MIPGEQPNMMQLLQQAQQMQQQLQEQLASVTATGTAGGGLVTATVTGSGELTALAISPEAIDPSDPETLADLVIAAVRDATRAAADLANQAAAEAMGPLTGGLGGAFPGLPGF